MGLTKKILSDKYDLPFYRIKISDNIKEFPHLNFLCITYERSKNDKSLIIEIEEKTPETLFANVSSDQAIFLWYKFLHLFELHPCEKDRYSIPVFISEPIFILIYFNLKSLRELGFNEILLNTIGEIIEEILKIGYPQSKRITKDFNILPDKAFKNICKR